MLAQTDEHVHYTELLFRADADRCLLGIAAAGPARRRRGEEVSRFLFTTMPATGHVVPKLPLARELSVRGHEVRWYTGAAYRDEVLATGAVHHPIRSAEDFGGKSSGETFPELSGLTGIAMVRRALQRVFIDNAPGMLYDCQAILAEHPADAILSEPLFVAARWLYELGGPPWATLGETMLGTYSRDTAPFGPGLFPMRGPIANCATGR